MSHAGIASTLPEPFLKGKTRPRLTGKSSSNTALIFPSGPGPDDERKGRQTSKSSLRPVLCHHRAARRAFFLQRRRETDSRHPKKTIAVHGLCHRHRTVTP